MTDQERADIKKLAKIMAHGILNEINGEIEKMDGSDFRKPRKAKEKERPLTDTEKLILQTNKIL